MRDYELMAATLEARFPLGSVAKHRTAQVYPPRRIMANGAYAPIGRPTPLWGTVEAYDVLGEVPVVNLRFPSGGYMWYPAADLLPSATTEAR